MPKQGEVIDAETAYRIRQTFIEWFPKEKIKDLHDNLRPVIWPTRLLPERIQIRSNQLLICQRLLAHLVCYADYIEAVFSFPLFDPTNTIKGVQVWIHVFDYEGNYRTGYRPRTFVNAPEEIEKARKEFNLTEEEGLVYCVAPLDDFIQGVEESERLFFLKAFSMEEWAFSPYTSYRQRPRTKIGGFKAPPKKLPAIEITNLRIPEKKEPADSQNHFQYSYRFPVIGHIRRQPTKEGVKLIWIKEHIRGPKDAPLKPKPNKIYKVTR